MEEQTPQSRQSEPQDDQADLLVPFHFYDSFAYRLLRMESTAKSFVVHVLRKKGFQRLPNRLENSSFALSPTRQVSDELRQFHSDLWFNCISDENESREIRTHLEIVGARDPKIPLRVAVYSALDADQEYDRGEGQERRIAPRFSMVFNLGKRPLNVPSTTEGMFDDIEDLEGLGLRNEFVKTEIMDWSLDELLMIPDRRLACSLGIVRCSHEQERYGKEDYVRIARIAVQNEEWLRMVALCIVYRYYGRPKELALEALDEAGVGREEVETIAQEERRKGKAEGWTEGKAEGWTEGKAEGRAEGKAEGKAESFFLLVRKMFKEIPSKWEAQVLAASPEQIDEWMIRTIDAPDLETVFNGGKPDGDFH